MFKQLIQKLKNKINPQIDSNVKTWQILFERYTEDIFAYRIPGIVVCPGDIILVFCEARKKSASDFGEIYLAMKRSEDGGNTWSDMSILLKVEGKAVQNPCPVYDSISKEVVLPFIVDRKHPYVMKSKDLGLTWDEPRLIENLDKLGWAVNGPSAGHSIQLQNGRLVVPSIHNEGEISDQKKASQSGIWFSHLVYSDDHGETWELGQVWEGISNECCSVELSNGDILTILRPNKGKIPAKILLSTSTDKAETSSNPTPSKDLTGPICMASIAHYPHPFQNAKEALIFSNPNASFRENLCIRASLDNGKTWPIVKTLFPGKTAYSDIGILENGDICCVLECGKKWSTDRIIFARFSPAWLQ